jgi:hypothetical protein
MKQSTLVLASLLFGLCALGGVSGCASNSSVIVEGDRGKVSVETAPRAEGDSPRAEGNSPSEPGKIPPGHMPPPGACRIWYPDRPPGHQPPPGDCRALERQVPPGAWLIRA